VSVEDLTPVDQAITVKRNQIPVAYTLAGAAVLVVFFTWAPWILPASAVTILMNFFILVIMATMWNLLAGYAGMVSIGQQCFIGLGAYATLYFAIKGMDPFVAIPLAVVVCAVIAYPVTYLLFRLRGGYFSVATWVVADSAMLIIGSIAFFGGGTGHYLPGLTNLSFKVLGHDTYLAAWFVALFVVVATYILLRSRMGLVLSSVRDNEVASRSSGAKVHLDPAHDLYRRGRRLRGGRGGPRDQPAVHPNGERVQPAVGRRDALRLDDRGDWARLKVRSSAASSSSSCSRVSRTTARGT